MRNYDMTRTGSIHAMLHYLPKVLAIIENYAARMVYLVYLVYVVYLVWVECVLVG